MWLSAWLPGSLAGLSHLRTPDIGHGLGMDGCLAATLCTVASRPNKHLTVTPRLSESL